MMKMRTGMTAEEAVGKIEAMFNPAKKAVNWFLRRVEKRNVNLKNAAIKEAEEIREIGSKSARRIAYDAPRELMREALARRMSKQ